MIKTQQITRWLSILIIVLFLILSFDVFFEDYSIGEMAIAFLMHNIPTIILVIATVLAWNDDKRGVIGFALLGIFTIIFFGTYKDIIVFFIISFPFLLIASLHYYNMRNSG